VPLIKAPSRGNSSAGFALSYNSQSWRQDSGGTWKLGRDVGYGFGWRLQVGSVTPFYSGYYTLDHYVVADSTGAEYRLDVNNNGRWTSTQGFRGTLDSTVSPPRLYFNDGSFWVLGVESSGNEEDAGTYYPSLIEDSNGSYIQVNYAAGNGVGQTQSSARISAIYDPRGIPPDPCASGRCFTTGGQLPPPPPASPTYTFTYNADAIPHLTAITNSVKTPEAYTFTYNAQALNDPFASASFGNVSILQTVATTGIGVSTGFQYSGAGEMTQLTTPLGGVLQWQYRTYSYSGPRSYREVQTRYMQPLSGGTTYTWNIQMDSNPNLHASTTVADVGAGTSKVWGFLSTAPYVGFATSYEEHDSSNTVLLRKNYTWSTDASGNGFVSYALTTLNPGTSYQAQTATQQTLDSYGYGNLVQTQIFDYNNLSTPARTTNYTYVTDPNYTSRYVRNRLLTSTVTSASGTLTLATNTFDNPAICGSNTSPGGATLRVLLHDTSYYCSFNYRGNLTKTIALSGTTSFLFAVTGSPVQATDGQGKTISISLDNTTSIPTALTPNGNSNLSTSVSYASSWEITSVSGPNGSSSSTVYDTYGRPQKSYSPDGLETDYTYTYYPSANTQTATIQNPGGGTRYKKTTLDGFGRVTRVETGYTPIYGNQVIVNYVDTQYASCACSPLGKMYRVSQPYAPGATPVWTTYTYDGSGRTLTSTAADGASVTQTSYQGNQTTVTDPAGKWKTSVTDAMGNLTSVIEPNPAGGANLVTTYAYNGANQLLTVTMPRSTGTQVRSFTWSGTDMTSATNPENGTTTYTYDNAHHVLTRTDAKGQQTRYAYDSYGRMTSTQHYVGGAQQFTQSVWYQYDNAFDHPNSNFRGQFLAGRLSSVLFTDEYANGVAQSRTFRYVYSYNPAGRTTVQRLNFFDSQLAVNAYFDAQYNWNSEGKMTAMLYPGDPGNGDNPPWYKYGFDSMGRLNGVTENTCTDWEYDSFWYCAASNSSQVAGAAYSPAGQVTSLSYDGYNETRTYNSLLQLTRMTVPGVMDMQYQYTTGQNNGRMSQSTDGILGETVIYGYDSLNRLTSATATSNAWGTSYTYDGFGNLIAKTPTAGSAPYFSALIDPSTNRISGQQYDANGNPAVNGTFPYDVENRLLLASTPFAGGYTYDHNGKRVSRKRQALRGRGTRPPASFTSIR